MGVAGQMIMQKVSLLNETLGYWLQQIMDSKHSLEGLPYAGLISSFAFLQDDILFCDTDPSSAPTIDSIATIGRGFEISGCEIRVEGDKPEDSRKVVILLWGLLQRQKEICPTMLKLRHIPNRNKHPCDHHKKHKQLGRCDIWVNVEIPEGTELAAPLEEGCIWRQARGSAVEVSGVQSGAASSEKVGVAQQWYDELDNLAFSKPGSEPNNLAEEVEENISDISSQGGNTVHIDCAVNISPGTSEVVINAVLYLKLTDKNGSCSNHHDIRTAEMILDISDHDRRQRRGADGCIHALLASHRNPRDLIFMKSLLLRIRLDCADHPKPENSTKEIVSTDSSLSLSVTLD
ncbi:hypothetical protein ACLOJK_008007 [Asimina triloba]